MRWYSKHQNDNEGYDHITTHEGHRFLARVNAKPSRGESEKAFLCKMWGGKGDTNHFTGGVRGFERTSMSTAIFIQVILHLQLNQKLLKSDKKKKR